MENKDTYTLEELREAADEQNLRVEEKDGKYRVVKTVSERFGLVTVKAGDRYSLNHDGLRKFLIFNSVDIGERITNWSKNMNQNYTSKQAMDKLNLTSRSAFYHFKRKYPHAFVVVNQRTTSGDGTLYDKQALDKFLEVVKSLKG